MSNPLEMLEIVDENDNIIGLETKKKIHEDELLHRDIHIWFITPSGEIVFQHRSKNKKLLPDKLDATVGGHVELNDSYEKTAIKECLEETGVNIDVNKLVFLIKMKNSAVNHITGKSHNAIGVQYAYLFGGHINDLKVEKEDGEGFELWKISDLSNLSESDKSKFIPENLSENMLKLFNKAKDVLLK